MRGGVTKSLALYVADTFKNSSMEHFISLWRGTTEARSSDPVWSALAQLPQAAQESIAAGSKISVGDRRIELGFRMQGDTGGEERMNIREFDITALKLFI